MSRLEREGREDVAKPGAGNTVVTQAGTPGPKPRMPHESDESADSQVADNPHARRIGQIAHDAVEQGQQDTSKAQELDATYHRVRQESGPAPPDKPTRERS